MDPIGPVLPDLPTTWELMGRILLAAFLGMLIGLERELNDHPSGIRTHIAVTVGAALFGVCSAYAFQEFIALRNDNNYQVDVTRVASQVVVGVGFLGGGAIIKQGNSVRGLTSAAGLWVSSAVGLAVALGMWREATVATLVLILSFSGLKRFTRWLRRRVARHQVTVAISMPLDADTSGVVTALGALADTVIHSIVVRRHRDEETTTVEAELEVRGGMLESRMAAIESRPDVLSLEIG